MVLEIQSYFKHKGYPSVECCPRKRSALGDKSNSSRSMKKSAALDPLDSKNNQLSYPPPPVTVDVILKFNPSALSEFGQVPYSDFVREKITGSKTTPSNFCLFDYLPVETILLIFSFLPTFSDSLNTRLVCHAWEKWLRDKNLRKLIYLDDSLRQSEPFFVVPFDYMSLVQKDINENMRAVLIDWLVEVADEFQFHPETLFLCINYVDRYLAIQPVAKSKLQLLGVTLMIVAAKYEETQIPRVEEFVIVADNTYTREEIFDMEVHALLKLKFSVSSVTSRTFLSHFLTTLPLIDPIARNIISHLSNYLLELALLDYPMARVSPSLIASSALCFSLHTLGLPAWTFALEMVTQNSILDRKMQRCVEQMYTLFVNAPLHPQHVVYDKYCQDRFNKVALLQPPASFPHVSSQFFHVDPSRTPCCPSVIL